MTGVETLGSTFYTPENYQKLGIKRSPRIGTAALLESNEQFQEETLQLTPKPNGYIVGIGNGSIWRMIKLFENGVLPKGIISLDRDPSVILSGKILIELAEKNAPHQDVHNYFYEGQYDEMITLAEYIIQKEQNAELRTILHQEIDSGQFISDLKLLHDLENNLIMCDIRRRKNITEIIFSCWSTICALARQHAIAFLHSDANNKETLQLIATHLPDLSSARNVLYISNIVDRRYRHELHSWELFNASGESWYVFTSEKDDYILQASHQVPAYNN